MGKGNDKTKVNAKKEIFSKRQHRYINQDEAAFLKALKSGALETHVAVD